MSLIRSIEAQSYLRFIYRNIFAKINLIQLIAFINEKEALQRGSGLPEANGGAAGMSARDSGQSQMPPGGGQGLAHRQSGANVTGAATNAGGLRNSSQSSQSR